MTASRLDGVIARWGASGIALTAAALPWERFQFVPTTELTLVRIGATITILAAVVSWVKSLGKSFPRTRILPCIVLFAFAAMVALPRSYDSAATNALIRVYVTYAAFFLSMATFVQTPDAALRLVRVFVISAIGVAAITVLAAGGLMWPARWDTAFWPQQRLLEEFRGGQPMRVTGAGLDFNQHSLYLLVGLAGVLFLSVTTRLGRIVQVLAAALLVTGVALSMSRSGIVIAAGMVFAALLIRTRGAYRVAAVAGIVAIVGLGAWLAGDFTAMFATRVQGGTVYDEGSARNRLEIYRIAFALAPRFALRGAGLGASEAAMQASEFGEDAVMAIHSMPLLLLIELGVLGLAAYGWLWWRVVRFGARPLLHSGAPQSRTLGAVFSGMSAATFAMLLVQPLMMLPLYPFLLGLGFGPVSNGQERSPRGRPAVSNGLVAATMLITFVCVAENRFAFQKTARQVEAFADTMHFGLDEEQSGRWESAAAMYSRGGAIGHNLATKEYYDEVNGLIDLAPLFAAFGAESPADPEAVAWLAAGRAYLAEGDYAAAADHLTVAWSMDPQFAYMQFHLGEANWAVGNASDAVALYQAFRSLPSDNGGPVDRIRAAIAFEETDVDDASLNALLRRSAFARRDGRWDDAVQAAAQAASLDATCAEAQYLLGVAAEQAGDSGEAFYRAALNAEPNHRLAGIALARIESDDG